MIRRHKIFLKNSLGALIAALLITLASCAPLRAQDTGLKQPQQPEKKSLVPPPAPGMQLTLKGGGPRGSALSVLTLSFKNTTGKAVSIKNEFMSTIQESTSFVRVFIDDKETAGTELYHKKMLIRVPGPVLTFSPGEEKNVLELEFVNMPMGNPRVYISYSSQVFNYEKKRYDWWLGTATSNTVIMHVAPKDVDAKIVATGNKIMSNIVAAVRSLGDSYGELKSMGGGNIKHGAGTYAGINQIVFTGKSGLELTVQVRSSSENISPFPQFDLRFPYLGIAVICYWKNNSNSVMRNAVFNAVRENAQEFNHVTKEVSDKKNMDVVQLSKDTMGYIDAADMIIQGQVVTANPEITENMEQQWTLSVEPRKFMKGTTKNSKITVITDSPTIRFKGAFVGKQFIMFLDMKYRDPETYTLMGAEVVNSDIISMIEEKTGVQKKEK